MFSNIGGFESNFSGLPCGKIAKTTVGKKGILPSSLRLIARRLAKGNYNRSMAKRTSHSDAQKMSVAADLEELVQDNREGWRASDANAHWRQQGYKALSTRQSMKLGTLPAKPASGQPRLS